MTTPSRDTFHSIPKLEGVSNYEPWHVLVKASLVANGVWKFVTGVASSLKDVDEKDYHFYSRDDAYRPQEAHARLIILTSCRPHIQATIARVDTAKDCWDKLKLDFQSNSLIEKHDLWVDFVECTYKGEEIGAFCIRYQEAVDRYLGASIKIKDTIQVM